MSTTGRPGAAPRDVAAAMAAAAATWLAAPDDDQLALASWPAPGSDAQTEDEVALVLRAY